MEGCKGVSTPPPRGDVGNVMGRANDSSNWRSGGRANESNNRRSGGQSATRENGNRARGENSSGIRIERHPFHNNHSPSTGRNNGAPLETPGSSARRGQSNQNLRSGGQCMPSSADNNSGYESGRKQIFPSHIPRETALARVAAGDLFQGTLRINHMNRRMAYVTTECGSLPCDILIDGLNEQNRALEGDKVAVELMPEKDWQLNKRAKPQDPSVLRLADMLDKVSLGDELLEEFESDGLVLEPDMCMTPALDEVYDPSIIPGVPCEAASYPDSARELWKPVTPPPGVGQEEKDIDNKLCERGVAARRGGLRPQGRVVAILQRKKTNPLFVGTITGLEYAANGGYAIFKPSDSKAPLLQMPAHLVRKLEVPMKVPVAGRQTPDRPVEDDSRRKDTEQERSVLSGNGQTRTGAAEECVSENNVEKEAIVSTVAVERQGSEEHVHHVVYQLREGLYLARMRANWEESHKSPQAEDAWYLGEIGSIEAETRALLIENGVDHGLFPLSVFKELDTFMGPSDEQQPRAWTIPEAEIAKRRDYRSHRIFTIDPPTARDLDDALHITELEDGTIEIGVHIADVSYFVAERGAVDLEARRRATTVYLVQTCIPMLPPLLCEQLCSLNPGVDRLAYSCVWRMDREGRLLEDEPWFGRTVIRSCCKLDYGTAQRMIDGTIPLPLCRGGAKSLADDLWEPSRRPTGGHDCHGVASDVLLLHKVAAARRKERFDGGGALQLQGVKLSFKYPMGSNPEDVTTQIEMAQYPIRQSNNLIEEYMLLANYLVARRLGTSMSGSSALLRCHAPPAEDAILKMQAALAAWDIDIDVSSAASLHKSIDTLVKASPNADVMLQTITFMLTVPMKPAMYFAAGDAPPSSWRHYALNIPYYTHFTSPIRRYADLVVHRLLTAVLDDPIAAMETYTPKDIAAVAKICNEKKLSAKRAQERSDEVFLWAHLKRLATPRAPERAVVVSLGQMSFTVYVPALGIQDRIYVDKIKGSCTGDFDTVAETLSLERQHAPKEHGILGDWRHCKIHVLKDVWIQCVCKDTVPVSLSAEFIGPYME